MSIANRVTIQPGITGLLSVIGLRDAIHTLYCIFRYSLG